jgi:hypothetical protein
MRTPDDVERAAIVELGGKSPRFRLRRFKDVTIDGSARYLIKGLIPAAGLVVVYGAPKSGKSFFAFDMTMAIARGRDYRGRRVKRGPVVYLGLEGAKGWEARFAAYRRGMAESEDPAFYLVTDKADLIADHGTLIDCIKAQIKGGTPAAVVIDTLNRSLNGSESKDDDMSRYIRAADTIRDAFNCAVVVVHHSGIETSRPRGHTSLTGAADTQIKVERDGAGNIIATVEWMKDGPDGGVIASRLESVEIGRDEDGDPVTSCIIVPVEGIASPAMAERKARLPKAATTALRALRKAVSEAGQPAPASNHVPDNVPVVTGDVWREYAYRAGISSSTEPRARQQAFRRGWDYLVGAGLVGAWEPYVWEVHREANR